MKNVISILCLMFFAIFCTTLFGAAEDPLRGTELRKHLTGPQVELGSLKGKVVFFEYWGYR